MGTRIVANSADPIGNEVVIRYLHTPILEYELDLGIETEAIDAGQVFLGLLSRNKEIADPCKEGVLVEGVGEKDDPPYQHEESGEDRNRRLDEQG